MRVHLWLSPNLLWRCALLHVLEPGTVCMEPCIALQARVQVVDVDEAKRRFWRVTLGLERDTSQQPDSPTQLHYSRQLQSSIVVLDQMCTAVIESLDGVLAQFSSVLCDAMDAKYHTVCRDGLNKPQPQAHEVL